MPNTCLRFALIPALIGAAAASPRAAAHSVTQRPDSAVVVLLGTGMPVPNPDAAGPATAVVYGSRVFLFDAGPAVMRQLRAANLPIRGPTALFVTHLHSDHTVGLPDLIFTSWVMGRTTALRAYGPSGLAKMIDALATAYSEDIAVRSHGLEGLPANGWRVDPHETTGGITYDSGGVRVTAFKVLHGSWPVALAYRIDTPNRSIVISGDTRPSDELVAMSQGVDVLVHEVYPESIYVRNRGNKLGDTTNDYFRSFHTSDVQLGKLAARAQPKLLILSHIVRMGATDEALLAGVRAGGFTGRAVVGKDLARY